MFQKGNSIRQNLVLLGWEKFISSLKETVNKDPTEAGRQGFGGRQSVACAVRRQLWAQRSAVNETPLTAWNSSLIDGEEGSLSDNHPSSGMPP